MKPVLLLLDDEDSVLSSLRRALRRSNCQIVMANNGKEALDLLRQYEVALIISDLRMPHMNGVEFLTEARKIRPNTVRMVLSGYADLQVVTESINSGNIYKFLAKPWDEHELLQTVEEGFKHYRSIKSNDQFKKVYESALEGVMIVDECGVVESVNSAFTSMLGYEPGDIVGKHANSLRSTNHDDIFYQKFWKSLSAEDKWRGEIVTRGKDGKEVSQWLNVSTVKHDFGELSKYVAVFNDNSELKRQQGE